MKTFRQELEELLNRHSCENGSNTPDFILAEYLKGCLENFSSAINARDKWHKSNNQFFKSKPVKQ